MVLPADDCICHHNLLFSLFSDNAFQITSIMIIIGVVVSSVRGVGGGTAYNSRPKLFQMLLNDGG